MRQAGRYRKYSRLACIFLPHRIYSAVCRVCHVVLASWHLESSATSRRGWSWGLPGVDQTQLPLKCQWAWLLSTTQQTVQFAAQENCCETTPPPCKYVTLPRHTDLPTMAEPSVPQWNAEQLRQKSADELLHYIGTLKVKPVDFSTLRLAQQVYMEKVAHFPTRYATTSNADIVFDVRAYKR